MNEYVIFVHYLLFEIFISFNFYLFYFPGAAAEPLGSARGALRAPRSTGWEPLLYWVTSTIMHNSFLSSTLILSHHIQPSE